MHQQACLLRHSLFSTGIFVIIHSIVTVPEGVNSVKHLANVSSKRHRLDLTRSRCFGHDGPL
jgi:hypothetical protein